MDGRHKTQDDMPNDKRVVDFSADQYAESHR